ncbi:ribonuclease Oy [Leptidea sinapis]|uniref:ribonuclease Oy n=1 Tax=Leptidea sinapis TaxID=189913 RepID=UPI00214548D0|nr:ribonuclease Oy [Leptidea sinapis]
MNFCEMIAMNLYLVGITTFTCFAYIEPAKHDFDLLIFTQNWPETTCKEWKKMDPTHKCAMPRKTDAWSIHGIWPTKLGTIGPSFCNRTWMFDPEKIRPIEDELEEEWTNVFNGTSVYSLWAHEWAKHGTCAAVLEPLNSEYKYFSMGLHWLGKYSMANILRNENIVPSNTEEYHINDINNAIIKELGTDPAIECRIMDGESYLSEIRICFTKDLQLSHCDGVLDRVNYDEHSIITNCNPMKTIFYPHYKVQSVYMQLYRLVTWLQWFTL